MSHELTGSPPPPEVQLNPEAQAAFLETLRMANASISDSIPGFPILSPDRIKILDSSQYTAWLSQRDLAGAHPFYKRIVEKWGVQFKHTGPAFNDGETGLSFYQSSLFDQLGKAPLSHTSAALGLHLIKSTVSLGHDNIRLDSDAIQPKAKRALSHHLPQIPGVTKSDIELALRIIDENGCEVKIYGAAFQIWVEGKIFSPPIGNLFNAAIQEYIETPIMRNYITKIADEFSFPTRAKNFWLEEINDKKGVHDSAFTEKVLQLATSLGYTSESHIAGAYSSSQLGLYLFLGQYSS